MRHAEPYAGGRAELIEVVSGILALVHPEVYQRETEVSVIRVAHGSRYRPGEKRRRPGRGTKSRTSRDPRMSRTSRNSSRSRI